MHPPQGMVSPRGPVFNALVDRIEAPDPDTVVVHGKGPSGMLLALFASGHNAIIPKHIVEKDPINALKTQVVGTGPFRLKEPPSTTLWKYERNPEYFLKGSLSDEIEITSSMTRRRCYAVSKRIHWTEVFFNPNLTATWRNGGAAERHPSMPKSLA
jgi:ABC-type transport system substrate-binding protein